nr:PREDICTED: thyroid adenoma-associated protein homolog isoform X2 [Daucus carota subsp. sativus]
MEILFLENSLPLHKTLLGVLGKVKNFHGVIGECFRVLCEEYGGENGKGRRFCVSRSVLSVMGSPKLGYLAGVVEECGVLVGLDIVSGLKGVILETIDGSRPSPIVMEQCQESLSCMYYLLQKFPSKFSDGAEVKDENGVLEMIVTVILSLLKSSAFSRDCLVAAGVSFCAALQVCLKPDELGLAIVRGIFCENFDYGSDSELIDVTKKIAYEGNLFTEIDEFPILNRICLIRGILTAVSRTVLNTPFVVPKDGSTSFHTILYDGILPELCNYCENPIDSHFNFHALTVMQICLQQVKTCIQANPSELTENDDLISEEMGTRILRIIWNNLEDTLSQTVKQVHLIFDLFLDIQSSLNWAEGSDRIKKFLRNIASDLLRLGPRCKGRYVPLASLTRRLGAMTILDINPDLLFETSRAYVDDDVCCAVTAFLKCFLECLRDECWSKYGVESGYIRYRSHCLHPFLYGLASGIPKLRSNLNTYALPVLLEVDVDSIFPMLSISVGQCGESDKLLFPDLDIAHRKLTVEQQVAVLISILKVSRSLALIEGDIDWCEYTSVSQEDFAKKTEKDNRYATVCVKGISIKFLVTWLILALTHVDESLRVDAAESLFLNPKTSSLPSSLELSLMKEAVLLNMRCCSTAFQMKLTSLFRKFFSRVRTALERQLKQGIWRPVASKDNKDIYPCKTIDKSVTDRAEDLFQFMKWLGNFLYFSVYPSAPYERKIMAMDLMLIMNNAWSIVLPLQDQCDPTSSETVLSPYSKAFTSPESTLLLVGSIVDSWDRLRENSFRILLHFPSPLPGISSPEMIRRVIIWAKKLVCSPRVRESDAGALTMRLMFKIYVLELGWIIKVSSNLVYFHPRSELLNGDNLNGTCSSATIEYVNSLIDWLRVVVEVGEKDLSEACKNSFVHGILLTLRYTFEELDWNSSVVLCNLPEMKHALEKLLDLVMRITTLALWVVSADALHLPEDMDEMMDDDVLLLDASVEMDVAVNVLENEVKNPELTRVVGPSEQIVMVGCWLAMKEVSLLLGTIIRKIPLLTSDMSKSVVPVYDDTDAVEVTSYVMLDLKQLERIGNHFLDVLLKMKHNGAIDKTRAGFTALCNRLLCSNDPRLVKLTESWMEQLMERIVAKGQTVDDLLRRSAGIPAAFIAFFLSEPEGTPKRLLPRALRWLIDIAKRPLLDEDEAEPSASNTNNYSLEESCQKTSSTEPSHLCENDRISKKRDEGVIPTVHAFNVLKAAFNDTNLATDTSGFSAEALITSIRSFSSSYWEVRNSACLAFTALIRRMIGFLNVHVRASGRRAITGLEFFHRYPSLHPFLIGELKVATRLLSGSSGDLGSNLASVVHPSLWPMLILLSRLKPSPVTSEIDDPLDPFLFMPFIRRCSTQSNLRVRVLAAKSLMGLISDDKLPTVLLNIASELPRIGNQMVVSPDSFVSSNVTSGTDSFSCNSVHGMLLQLSSLLDNNCRNLTDFSKRDQILYDLIQVLELCSWIGNPRLCRCPLLNECFLRVLDNMLSIARTWHTSQSMGAIWKLLWELSSQCLDSNASRGVSYYDPTSAELRKQASFSYFNCVFQASKDPPEDDIKMPNMRSPPSISMSIVGSKMDDACFADFHKRLISSMSDESYEVRIATFKWLLQFLKASEFASEPSALSSYHSSIINWTNANLHATLMNLLAGEKNRRCIYYILKNLFTWNSLKYRKLNCQQCMGMTFAGNMDTNSLFRFWDKLVDLCKQTRHAKTRETLVCCMGTCVKRFANMVTNTLLQNVVKKSVDLIEADQCESVSYLYGCISYYINIIEQYSDSSQPVNMRRAASESIIASGLLDQAVLVGPWVCNKQILVDQCPEFEIRDATNIYAHKILSLWLTCITLLEDEDIGLRSKLAMEVQKSCTSTTSDRNFQATEVPSQVDKVIHLCFDHLSSVFGHWLNYFSYLAQWTLKSANNVVGSQGDLVKRVFDKEIDNHHEEKLLICQICCFHLEKLPVLKPSATGFSEMASFLQDWRMKFGQQLIIYTNTYIGNHGGTEWIGGVGNHKDAFLPVYVNLLAFYSLSKCIFTGDYSDKVSLLSELEELGGAIKPFLSNPFISNLYSLVVKSHEHMIGANVGSFYEREDDSLWVGFDPYFLIR